MSIINGQQGDGAGNSGQGSNTATGAGNQQVTDWRSGLPDDLRSEKVFESIKGKDWAEAGPILAKNYVHSQRMIGADKLIIPGEKATPEERAAFYTKLGRPEKPDGYGFKLPEGMDESQLDKSRLDKWRVKMHEAGLSKTQAEGIINEFLADEFGNNKSAQANHAAEVESWELGLKQEFGAKYDEKVNFARYAAKEFASPALIEYLDKTGLGSHPEIVKMLSAVGSRMSDDSARGSGGGNAAGRVTSPEAAQHALNEFNRDSAKQKALFNASDPMHAQVVKERAELFAIAFSSDKE